MNSNSTAEIFKCGTNCAFCSYLGFFFITLEGLLVLSDILVEFNVSSYVMFAIPPLQSCFLMVILCVYILQCIFVGHLYLLEIILHYFLIFLNLFLVFHLSFIYFFFCYFIFYLFPLPELKSIVEFVIFFNDSPSRTLG